MQMFRGRRVLAALVVFSLCAPALSMEAQRNILHRPEKTASVLMLSDLHFDPLSDPAKFEKLQATPVEGWRALLEAPDSADQAKAFAGLQAKCKVRGADSSWALLRNSLQSARLRSARAAFAVVAGDLLAHELDCRLRTLGPGMSEAEMSAFAAKTVSFLALEFHRMYPDTPVYLALGNNDSGCTDYGETPGSEFLKSAGESFAKAIPGSAALQSFSDYGDYSVAMPAPFQRGRLLVLQDDFLSVKYVTCAGKKTLESDKAQIDWLRGQLEKSRTDKEHVWVMAHIPPGVDVYKSFHQFVLQPAKLCTVKTPSMFLHSDALTDTLAAFSDVVELALFSHTHMDEIKLLHTPGDASTAATGATGSVPAKLVPSISPINGNHSAFLVAQVSTANARMLDYSTYVTSDPAATQWAKSYSFRGAYGVEDFSAASVRKVTDQLRADKTGASPVSRTYRQWFMPGDNGLIGLGLQQIWPAYSCSASESSPADFSRCMCPVQAAKAE